MIKKIKKIFIFFTLFTLLAAATLTINPSRLFCEPTPEELNTIQNEKDETHAKIEQAQKEQEIYAQQVQEVESKLLSSLDEFNAINNSVKEIKSKIDQSTIELVSNQNDLDKIEKELSLKTNVLNNRVAEIYKSGNRSFLNFFLKTENFTDFVSRIKFMTLLVKQDLEIIDEIKGKKAMVLAINKNILNLQENQKSEKEDLEKLLKISVEKKNEVEKVYYEKKDLFSEAKANKDALIEMENQLAAKELEIGNELEGINYGNAPTGKLLWPTNGKMSSPFGTRTSKGSGITRLHNGMDIYASIGTPVIAADSGQVLKAGYESGGYGNAVLIYHGGGIATFYAHLSGFAVSVNQFVQKGQVIGYVGVTGFTTGPHLHFEVRVNGSARNPASFLF